MKNNYDQETLVIASHLTPGTISADRQTRGMRNGDPCIVIADALLRYAKEHKARFESPLSEDYFLGPAWLAALTGVRSLLNGEGSFDGGCVDSVLMLALKESGYTEDNL